MSVQGIWHIGKTITGVAEMVGASPLGWGEIVKSYNDLVTGEKIGHFVVIRKRSPASGSGKSSPWDTDYEEMAKKTIINWGYKSLPKLAMSDKAKDAITILNRVEDDQFHEYIQSIPKNNDDGFEEEEEV